MSKEREDQIAGDYPDPAGVKHLIRAPWHREGRRPGIKIGVSSYDPEIQFEHLAWTSSGASTGGSAPRRSRNSLKQARLHSTERATQGLMRGRATPRTVSVRSLAEPAFAQGHPGLGERYWKMPPRARKLVNARESTSYLRGLYR